MEDVGMRIKRLRKGLDLTQADIARSLGISDVAVGNWERGQNLPRGANLIRLSRLLRVKPEEIVGMQAAQASELEHQADLIRQGFLDSGPEIQEVLRKMLDIPGGPDKQGQSKPG